MPEPQLETAGDRDGWTEHGAGGKHSQTENMRMKNCQRGFLHIPRVIKKKKKDSLSQPCSSLLLCRNPFMYH